MISKSHLRTFIALRPDLPVIETLERHIEALRSASWARHVRWIPGPNVHLTLRFLGSTAAEAIPAIVADLEALRGRGGFPLCIERIALFPDERRPRVIAAHLAPSEPLQALAAELESLAVRHGFVPEKRSFQAHLTVARTQRSFPRGARLEYEFAPIDFIARDIVLFESETLPSGAVYTPLTTVALATG